MSYDCYLTIDTGGEHRAQVAELGNMTSNVSGMWARALGFPLADLHGRTGGECAPHLARAIRAISDPLTRADYKAMNPTNGWGNVGSAEQYLRTLFDGCEAHPKATFEVSR